MLSPSPLSPTCAQMTDLHSQSFDFEADFTSDLRCIPMAVRRKLDLAGVKLKLSHWGALAGPERQRTVRGRSTLG